MANLGTPVEGTKLQFGTLHPELQQFDAFEVDGGTTLTTTTTKVDPADIGTWVQQWPPSSKAFYTPRLMAGEQLECPFLTYGDLCQQMEQCPTKSMITDAKDSHRWHGANQATGSSGILRFVIN